LDELPSRVNLYDFFRYIFPGSTLLTALLLILNAANILSFNFYNASPAFLVFISICLLGVSYILGHLLQSLGEFLETEIIYNEDRKRVGRKNPSKAFLEKNDSYYTTEFKNKLKTLINQTFNFSHEYPPEKAFEFCYIFVLQKKLEGRIERYLSFQKFYRGMNVAFSASSILLFTFYIFNTSSSNFPLLAVGFFILSVIFYFRFIYYCEKFTDAVYREFYVFQSMVDSELKKMTLKKLSGFTTS
jgi:hypothetical protein